MSELEMKLHCLQLAGGDVDRAQRMYEWLTEQAPAQPVHPEAELTTLGPRDPFLDSIMARGGTWHDGGPNPLPDQFVDIYVPARSTNLLNKPNHLEGQPSNAYVWEGWEVAYCASSATAPLIDAQTTDPVDPRIECASDEPDALAEFMKLPGAVKWGGGECPVPQSAVVEYLLRGADLPPLDPKPAFLLSWDHADILGDIIAYRVVSEPAEQYDDPTAVAIAAYIEAENEAPAPEQPSSVEIEQEADIQYLNKPVEIEPGPYDAAVEKGAITQDEADFLVSERERIAADEQRSIVEKIGGLFKREKEEA